MGAQWSQCGVFPSFPRPRWQVPTEAVPAGKSWVPSPECKSGGGRGSWPWEVSLWCSQHLKPLASCILVSTLASLAVPWNPMLTLGLTALGAGQQGSSYLGACSLWGQMALALTVISL